MRRRKAPSRSSASIATPQPRICTLARWGLVPYWAKDQKFGYSTINARAEDVLSKPAFREAFKKRRCLVPADAFYEWQAASTGNKDQKQAALRHRSPLRRALCLCRPLGFAGSPKRGRPSKPSPSSPPTPTKSPRRSTTACLSSSIAATTTAGSIPASPQRPPTDLLRPYPAEKMRAWPVGDRVGNVRNDDAALLTETEPAPENPGLFG